MSEIIIPDEEKFMSLPEWDREALVDAVSLILDMNLKPDLIEYEKSRLWRGINLKGVIDAKVGNQLFDWKLRVSKNKPDPDQYIRSLQHVIYLQLLPDAEIFHYVIVGLYTQDVSTISVKASDIDPQRLEDLWHWANLIHQAAVHEDYPRNESGCNAYGAGNRCRWYSSCWEGAEKPELPEVTGYVSLSQISNFKRCPRLWRIEAGREDEYEEPKPLLLGKLFHKIVAENLRLRRDGTNSISPSEKSV